MITSSRVAWICFLVAMPGLAQSNPWRAVQAIAPGTSIEVQLQGAKHRGALRAATDESLSLTTGTGELSLSRAEIRKVKVRRRNFRRRILIAAAIGAAVGIAASAPFRAIAGNEGTGDKGAIVGAGAAAGAALGAGVGALFALSPGYYTVYDSR